MSYVNKSYLSTQFSNFATKIASVFAKKTEIPNVGNGTITIYQNGVKAGIFTTNQDEDAIIELTDNDTTYSAATTSTAGLMSASDKSKLDGIASSADSVSFSQNLTSGIKIGTLTINDVGINLYAPTSTLTWNE